jgi:uncharacterized protein (TIGR02680 family)
LKGDFEMIAKNESEEIDIQNQQENRWHMHRAGLLNFWFYDEEEFQLEEGRLILRGANGSGKSVTMQSFLPLVLDGDKRPTRLDPFGSRDRKIEYYLLGEADSKKTDVTGYLWLEFYHPGKGLYKTIGIGIRARRGMPQVQFWGFLLDDGRRIGRDFHLYDYKHLLEQKNKIPLGRRELEEQIGAGGQVVQEQTAYREMVNKQLFGFAEGDSFQDLLQLLIQLRSPKLSKDFKPTALYEILHSALPALQEEELSPLSEVLEDMDQITDGLDEVRLHRKEMARLQEIYERYNKQVLYLKSVNYIDEKAAYDTLNVRAQVAELDWKQAEAEMQTARMELDGMDNRLVETAEELNVLNKHESIGKQRELELAAKSLSETEDGLKSARERIKRYYQQTDKLGRDVGDAESKRELLGKEQQELLDELEAMSEETEFTAYSVYRGYWHSVEPDHDDWKGTWLRDIREHRSKLEKAFTKAQEESEAARNSHRLEEELGEARKERDQAEETRSAQDRKLEQTKDLMKETVLLWRKELLELSLNDDTVGRTFAGINTFGIEAPSADLIREPIRQAYDTQKERLSGERLAVNQQRENLAQDKSVLEAEKLGWEQMREPEPKRSEARATTRFVRDAKSGAPLFAVCDFHAHVKEETRAMVEETLERAGLLDAWISPNGQIAAVSSEGEEVWILPRPYEIGYTLADILLPAPSEESGLTAALVDAVLRTFLWNEAGDLTTNEPGEQIVSAGKFRLGALVGVVAKKDRAAFIGKETRKQTRVLEIERLQQEIEKLILQIQATDNVIEKLKARESLMREEHSSFPQTEPLQKDLQKLQAAIQLLETSVKQEERILERYKLKTAEWRELQRQLNELTASWTHLKREKALKEAVSVCRDYESAIISIHAIWQRSRETLLAIIRYQEELNSITIVLEEDEVTEDELDQRRRQLQVQTDTLRKLMEELGLTDVSNRIEALNTERVLLHKNHKIAEKAHLDAGQLSAAAMARTQIHKEQLKDLLVKVEQAVGELIREMERKLVAEWRDREVIEFKDAGITNLSKEIKNQYDMQFSNRNPEKLTGDLLEQYNSVRAVLTDYILETDVEEDTGRIIITSKRDRLRPQPLYILLEEMQRLEDEQSLLLSEKDRELYEEIILRSVGKAIRQRIHRAEAWVRQMNKLMEDRNTSSGLRLRLEWEAKPAQTENQMDTSLLVELLKRDSHRLREAEIDQIIGHFRSQIGYAKQSAQDEQESMRKHLYEMLDYRNWFSFELRYRKGEQVSYRTLTDARFNVLSGGEKAMAMYIPLFAATWSRYSDARADCPRMISLDEAFAGVDEENMRDMFKLLTDMGFDYMMTSQVLWGCYDTVPSLAIYEIHRPKDAAFVTLFRYRWNGHIREYVEGVTGS